MVKLFKRRSLAELSRKNFEQFASEVTKEIREAGPKVR